jgi:ribosomal protein S18 acetylase RimI-like enzyme
MARLEDQNLPFMSCLRQNAPGGPLSALTALTRSACAAIDVTFGTSADTLTRARRDNHPLAVGASTMTQIRQATANDVPLLLPLVAAYWAFEDITGFDLSRVSSQLARLLGEPRFGCGWIALVDGVPVGYLVGVYVFSLEHLGLTAEIDEFFVLPQYRSHGIGVEMLRVAELEFIHAGCTNVSLQLSRDNDSARAFYHRRGYTERSRYELLDKMLHDG